MHTGIHPGRGGVNAIFIGYAMPQAVAHAVVKIIVVAVLVLPLLPDQAELRLPVCGGATAHADPTRLAQHPMHRPRRIPGRIPFQPHPAFIRLPFRARQHIAGPRLHLQDRRMQPSPLFRIERISADFAECRSHTEVISLARLQFGHQILAGPDHLGVMNSVKPAVQIMVPLQFQHIRLRFVRGIVVAVRPGRRIPADANGVFGDVRLLHCGRPRRIGAVGMRNWKRRIVLSTVVEQPQFIGARITALVHIMYVRVFEIDRLRRAKSVKIRDMILVYPGQRVAIGFIRYLLPAQRETFGAAGPVVMFLVVPHQENAIIRQLAGAEIGMIRPIGNDHGDGIRQRRPLAR